MSHDGCAWRRAAGAYTEALELGGKSPNIFFNDVMAAHDDYQDKALEGFTMFTPTRARCARARRAA